MHALSEARDWFSEPRRSCDCALTPTLILLLPERANRIYLENLPNTWQQQKLVLSSLIKKLDRAWKSLLSLSWKEGVLCLNRDTVEVLLHLLTQEEASTIHTGSPGQPRGMGEVYSWTTVLKSQLHVKNYRGLLPT